MKMTKEPEKIKTGTLFRQKGKNFSVLLVTVFVRVNVTLASLFKYSGRGAS